MPVCEIPLCSSSLVKIERNTYTFVSEMSLALAYFSSKFLKIISNYSDVRLRRDTYSKGEIFPLFQPPFQRIFGINDTSFESPDIGRLESAKKFGVASS